MSRARVDTTVDLHGVRCARIMGHTTPTSLQLAVTKHAAATSDAAHVQFVQARPRTGKTIATAMGALLGVRVRVRRTQSVLVCSTIEQRDHTMWTVCRMLGENADRVRVVTASTGRASRDRWGAANTTTAHVLVGCTGAVYQTAMKHPEMLEHVRFMAVHDADIMFGAVHTDQIAQISALMQTLCGRVRVCLVSTTYGDDVLRRIRAVTNGRLTDARDDDSMRTLGEELRGRDVKHMSVMVEREWKGDMVVHVTEWALRGRSCARVLVSCANGSQVDKLCDAFGADFRADVVGLHGKTDRRRWAHRRVAWGGANGRGLVVVSTENIAHDTRGVDFDVVVCGDAPFGIGGLVRLVGRVRRKGTVVHLLTRDDVITFQRTMRAHDVPVAAFKD